MKRTPLVRRTPLARAPLGAKPMPLARREPLKRTRMKRRRTRIKAGYEPKYRRFVRQLPCAVCTELRRKQSARTQFCHERVKGTGLALKSHDERGWPGCPEHHADYDQRRDTGFFAGWTNDQREAWVTSKAAPLRAAYLALYGSEPELRQPIAGRRAAA